MQKYLNKAGAFAEKNVEWLAVALGAFFFLFMTWTYVITKPVFKAMGGVVVTPGSVDETIDSTSGEALRGLMEVPPERVPKFAVNDFSDAVGSALQMTPYKPVELAKIWNYQPLQLNEVAGPQGKPTQMEIIQALPELPPATILAVESGKTTIMAPPAAPAAADATGTVPAAGAPPAVAAAPPAAGTPPAASAAPADSGTQDIEWATVICSVSSDALTKQWMHSFGPSKPGGAWKINNGAVGTQFVDVTAYRSEKLANGTWGPEVVVPKLWNNHVPPFPADGNKDAEMGYLGAISSTLDVATPRFPDLASGPIGTIWKDPVALVQSLIAKPAIDPNTAHAAPPTTTPPPTPAPTTPTTPAAPAVAAAPAVESTDPTIAKSDGALPTVAPLAATGNLSPAALPATPAPGAAVVAIPAATPDILIYVHDASIKPGATYKYRVVYKLRNPLFNDPPDNFKNPKWTDQFALTSPSSEYSAEVTVPLRTYFYCAQNGLPSFGAGDRLTFPFEVFSWGRGVWNKHTFTVNPGDEIGGTYNGVDFSTGYTYVDQRKHNGERSIVAVVDGEGNASLRDAEKDATNPDRKVKGQWVDAQAGTMAGASPVSAGSPAAGAAAGGAARPNGGAATPPPANNGDDTNSLW